MVNNTGNRPAEIFPCEIILIFLIKTNFSEHSTLNYRPNSKYSFIKGSSSKLKFALLGSFKIALRPGARGDAHPADTMPQIPLGHPPFSYATTRKDVNEHLPRHTSLPGFARKCTSRTDIHTDMTLAALRFVHRSRG